MEELNSRSASAYEVISVRMTKMSMPRSNARYSAAVKAQRGVMIRSMIGSLDRFKNMTTRLPVLASSKALRKYCATSFFTPMAAKTMAKLPPSERVA